MESVDVLVRIDGVNDLVFVDMLGERKLDKDTVDGRIPVVLVDQREKRLFADVRGLVVLNLMKAERQRRLHLQGHITDGSRIFSDQNGHKPRNRAVLFPNGLNFLTQFVKNRRLISVPLMMSAIEYPWVRVSVRPTVQPVLSFS